MQIACACASLSSAVCRFMSNSRLSISFVFAKCERRTASESFGELACGRRKLCGGHDAIVQSNSFRFSGADEVSRVKQFSRFRKSDHARQKIRRSHVSSRKSNLHEQESDLCFFTRNANV